MVSPAYSPTVTPKCPHVKCTVGRMQVNLNALYPVDQLKDVCREAEWWAIYIGSGGSQSGCGIFDPTAHGS